MRRSLSFSRVSTPTARRDRPPGGTLSGFHYACEKVVAVLLRRFVATERLRIVMAIGVITFFTSLKHSPKNHVSKRNKKTLGDLTPRLSNRFLTDASDRIALCPYALSYMGWLHPPHRCSRWPHCRKTATCRYR